VEDMPLPEERKAMTIKIKKGIKLQSIETERQYDLAPRISQQQFQPLE